MLTPHIYLNGYCRKAIELYTKAFNATTVHIIEDPRYSERIIHAVINIHGQPLILNDTGADLDSAKSGGYQLSVQFKSESELFASYSILLDGATILFPIQATDYSDCVVRFIDRFDVRWGFWV